ncbi:hypothetical protein [Liquorilactobacillus uvarum]|uniref:Uncharacterized protein n=1 Tax=Liquorilactobacillus uvarum DSM 19971 TaxID=1423812 RepID=A0A0R1Q2X4_9LACO|nr:hypothetical protein [Liquorilactobacillus uvarum]KRL36629.1 hypothetical protein FD20_GL001172 [Liquorilactobacillus uvarum DSM 19971]
MSLTVKDLGENVRKLNAIVASHVGSNNSNGISHLSATDDQDGFLSAYDKQQLDMKCRYATTVNTTGNDILSYNAGLYIGRSFKNAPNSVDDSLCLVEISGAGNGLYKKIEFVWLAASKTYYRYIYSASDSGWQSTEWLSILPLNGFTGTINARKIFTPNETVVEVRVNIQNSSGLTNGAITQIGTLPSSLGVTGVTPYWTIPAQSKNTNCTINAILQSATALSVFRNEANSAGITQIWGNLMYGI